MGNGGGREETKKAGQWEERYRKYRSAVFAIAYRMLGSAADAEDVVQDVFLSVPDAGPEGADDPIRHEKAYLSRMAVNRCLNLLNSSARKRETYVGPWLPEPLVRSEDDLPEEAAERGEAVSYAFMVLLEKLGPLERAVFVLRETLGYDYAAIAGLVGKSEANCRQIYGRAKRKLGDGAPVREPLDFAKQRGLVRGFVESFREGRTQELVRLLASDAVLMTDGGGKVRAAVNPIYGRDRGLALLAAMAKGSMKGARFEEVAFGGGIGLAAWQGDRLHAVIAFDWSGEDEPLRNLFTIFNPDKLALIRPRLTGEAVITKDRT